MTDRNTPPPRADGRLSRPWAGPMSRGMAALTVVLGLFFTMAMVAAYTNRNIVFEQRMSVNSYRAERAVAAADGAIDWALVMMNGGRVRTDTCAASTDDADPEFRSRYLALDPVTGGYGIRGVGTNPIFPACMANVPGQAPGLTCICPTLENPAPSITGTDSNSAFRVSFGRISGETLTRPGTVMLIVRGCSSAGSGTTSCMSREAANVIEADGISQLRTNVGLVRALPAAPVAALTTGGNASVSAGGTIVNPDPLTGITVHTGGSFTSGGTVLLRGAAGSSGDGVLPPDPALFNLIQPLASPAYTTYFRSTFGMGEALYRTQPALVRVACPTGTCTVAELDAANWISGFPGRTIMVDGNLDLASAVTPAPPATLGNATEPLMLVVNGTLTLNTNFNVVGFLYARDIVWTGAAATATVQGAVVAARNFSADVPVTIAYDADVMNLIAKSYGSFVRLPGGWNRGN